jgi:hypothetical protein
MNDMKKKAFYLMIACLSLIACPQLVKAGTELPVAANTETVMNPSAVNTLLDKVDGTKKPHLVFHKKDAVNQSAEKRAGGVIYISGAALVLIIILLIILL